MKTHYIIILYSAITILSIAAIMYFATQGRVDNMYENARQICIAAKSAEECESYKPS